MRRDGLLDWIRFVLGGACVAIAVVYAAIHIPTVVQALNGDVAADAYITSAQQRVITSGDSLGISADLQSEALLLLPKRSTYALVLPADMQVAANRYGIGSLTYGVLPAWFLYLLLPAEPVPDPRQAEYIVCWGCDRAHWNPRTTWLWDNRHGQSIGRVRR